MSMMLAGFAMGFLGSSHCVAMCGGLAAALPSASGAAASRARTCGVRETETTKPRATDLQRTMAYNLGRVSSYAIAGTMAGAAGAAFAGMGGAAGALFLRGLSALLVIGVGLYVGGWSNKVVRIEKLGGGIWRRIAPLARRARASESPLAGLLFGAMWGWLPCGLVYSALAVAAASGSSGDGAMLMIGFGLGTLPAMFLIGVAAGRGTARLRGRTARQFAGAMVVCFGLWTFLAAASASIRMAEHGAAACHEVGASDAPAAAAAYATGAPM